MRSFSSLLAIGAIAGRILVIGGDAPFICFSSAEAAPRANVETLDVDRADDDFAAGRFVQCALRTDALLARSGELAAQDLTRVIVLKVRLAVAFDKPSDVDLWLQRLAAHDAKAQLDPLRDPPFVIEKWRVLQTKAAETRPISSPPVVEGTPPPAQKAGEKKEVSTSQGLEDSGTLVRAKSRFWVSLLPFGVGHFANDDLVTGGIFLGGEAGLILAMQGLENDEALRQNVFEVYSGKYDNRYVEQWEKMNDLNAAVTTTEVLGLIALWGYELNDLMPVLRQQNPSATRWIRWGLSVAPFGAAQVKNGQLQKAMGIALTEAAFLTLSAILPKENQRTFSQTLFWGTVIFGAYDGWLFHEEKTGESMAAEKFRLEPGLLLGGRNELAVGVRLAATF